MTRENRFFFDSYAIIELLKGNPNYKSYINTEMVTTKLNLFEVSYFLLRDFGEKKASEFLRKYSNSIVDFNVEVIIEAAKFKLRSRAGLSMVDCIGYVLAKFLGIKFLTGDDEFKNLDNVEFVK